MSRGSDPPSLRVLPQIRSPEEHADRAVLEPRLVASIAAAGARGQWRASAFLLERLYPDRWGDERVSGRGENLDDPFGDTASVVVDPFREVDELARRRREATIGPCAARANLASDPDL